MTARRTIAGVLATATVTSGLGLLAAPTAIAKPNQNCGRYIQSVQSWRWQVQYSMDNYGVGDSRTDYAYKQYQAAQDRSAAAGC